MQCVWLSTNITSHAKRIRKINKNKGWLLEWINTVNKPVVRLTKRKREKIQTVSIRNERGAITTEPIDIKRIIKEYCQQFYAHKSDSLVKGTDFLKDNLTKLTQGEINNLNGSITIKRNLINN